jgi:Fic family protein
MVLGNFAKGRGTSAWHLGSSAGQGKVLAQAATIPMNKRQIKVLNRLLDGFEGNLTTSKWAAIAKCSQDTALRDITELVQYEVLQKTAAGGRSTHYKIRHSDFQR